MKLRQSEQRGLLQQIDEGIMTRGFHILSRLEEIAGSEGGRQEKLSRVQRLAQQQGWQVTVHDENGWILFSHEPVPSVPPNVDRSGLASLFESLHSLSPWRAAHRGAR